MLVHGFTQTSASWRRVGAALAGDHEVVAVDAPGHGRSAAVRADLWEGGRLLGAVGGDAAYVGYSMGGRLALHLALQRPDLVRRLVLVGATAGLDDADGRAARRKADEALAGSLEADGLDAFLQRWVAQPLFAGLPPDAVGLEDRRSNTVEGLASALRLAGTGTQDPPLWDRLPALGAARIEVLVVVGEHDPTFRALGARLADGIGPTATVAMVPGAGHAVHLERPDPFLDVVRPFLAES